MSALRQHVTFPLAPNADTRVRVGMCSHKEFSNGLLPFRITGACVWLSITRRPSSADGQHLHASRPAVPGKICAGGTLRDVTLGAQGETFSAAAATLMSWLRATPSASASLRASSRSDGWSRNAELLFRMIFSRIASRPRRAARPQFQTVPPAGLSRAG